MLVINQPTYLPWTGYFDLIDQSSVFVFLDDVQFIKREWKNRNRIRKTEAGNDAKWLTVPIEKQSQTGLIKDAIISHDFDWCIRHTENIKAVYKNTQYFDIYFWVRNIRKCRSFSFQYRFFSIL